MRILYIITKAGAGGAQTHVRQLSKYMSEHGHQVAIMSQPGDWPVDKVYPNKFLTNSYNPVLGLKAMREIRRVVREFRPDVVHCHSTIAGLWGRFALKSFGYNSHNKPKVIFTAHGWAFTEGTPQLRRMLAIGAEKIAAFFCAKIICVSEYDRQLALKYKIAPEKKLITIHNGVELNNANNTNLNTNQLIDTNIIRIVFVGRLAEQKDPELLLEAFGELPDEVRNKAEVLMVGDGPKRDQLELLVTSYLLRVTFLGDIPREKVLEVLSEGDIFVLTSHYEGFPITILEAMSYELPVIASDVGGVSEAVDESCGVLIGRGEASEAKTALEMLIEDEELRTKMGKNARVKVEKEFSIDKMLKETISVYNANMRI